MEQTPQPSSRIEQLRITLMREEISNSEFLSAVEGLLVEDPDECLCQEVLRLLESTTIEERFLYTDSADRLDAVRAQWRARSEELLVDTSASGEDQVVEGAEAPTEQAADEALAHDRGHAVTEVLEDREMATELVRLINAYEAALGEQLDGTDEHELAAQVVSDFLEQYGRREYPSEAERRAALQPYVKAEQINEMCRAATSLSLIDRLSANKRAAVRRLREALSDRESTPFLIGRKEVKRHHGGGGSYLYHYDQHGNTYFIPPDGTLTDDHQMYGDLVNLPRHENCMMRSAHVDGGWVELPQMRLLAEAGHTVNRADIAAEMCDAIDPMAVPDADRSFLSAVAYNLYTGCSDALICWSRHEKNQVIRADGVYYLFDTSPPSSPMRRDSFIKQLQELQLFLDERGHDPEAYVAHIRYFAQVLTVLPARAHQYKGVRLRDGQWQRPTFLSSLISLMREADELSPPVANALESELSQQLAAYETPDRSRES